MFPAPPGLRRTVRQNLRIIKLISNISHGLPVLRPCDRKLHVHRDAFRICSRLTAVPGICSGIRACSCIPAAPCRAFVTELQVNYLGECRAGEVLTLRGGLQDGTGLVSGEDAGGEARFTGLLRLGG